ncbi:MAG: DUF3108 domain-containing protein [Candidatus Kapaibacterium sp.]
MLLQVLLLPFLFLFGANHSSGAQAIAPVKETTRNLPNTAFDVGERLVFDINYGFVTAGHAVMVIPGYKYVAGKKSYEINTYAVSTDEFDNIFKVRDKYSSFVDVDGIYPHRFEQHVREGKYSKDYEAFFDQDELTAETDDGTKYKIPQYVHDILSAFYYVRTLDLTQYHKGDKISLQNFYDGKTHPLDVIVLGRQRIEVEAGTFDCIVVEPMVVEGGLFQNEGSIKVWLTNDANKMPVKVSTKVIVGSIDVSLTKYQGLKNPVLAKVD